ncbi:MAG: cytochrome-c peroxidase, partial [bacterium]
MKSVVIFLMILFVFLFNSFIAENPFYAISDKDVEFKCPENFPKPVYNFKKNKITRDGFLLGRKLFYDTKLAKDNITSCASCHQRFAAFSHVDHALAHGISGLIGKRNVPALQNLVWKNEYMADGGINHMDLQPIAPLTSPNEMGETLENVVLKLRSDSLYPEMFKKAFGDTAVTTERMMKSISQFLALMVSNDSKYDKYIAGKEKFTDKEINGLQLFRQHCVTCHKEPMFTDYSYRNIGLMPDTALKDSGRAIITKNQKDYMKFQVPGLRNIEMTYPYMHDGRFMNLEQVMDHYSNKNFFTNNVDPEIKNMSGLTPIERIEIII